MAAKSALDRAHEAIDRLAYSMTNRHRLAKEAHAALDAAAGCFNKNDGGQHGSTLFCELCEPVIVKKGAPDAD